MRKKYVLYTDGCKTDCFFSANELSPVIFGQRPIILLTAFFFEFSEQVSVSGIPQIRTRVVPCWRAQLTEQNFLFRNNFTLRNIPAVIRGTIRTLN
ncbi:hypothetical protein C3460_00235 [Serratia marcescens]|nr:hypothetical protein C3462_00235 [Serratia marcescens]POX02442.1 hypothetical protein C3466_00235 [Serratia marcescens]POX16666.1 hypothetical protein C3460_00235 [Serratia marcescens]RTF43662.1 hypothetical protein D9B78_20535 [Serratia marcescens]